MSRNPKVKKSAATEQRLEDLEIKKQQLMKMISEKQKELNKLNDEFRECYTEMDKLEGWEPWELEMPTYRDRN
jgi:uncharacterized coiled-coil protein SlyX